MNKEDFASFEQAKRLKALGYKQSVSNRLWYLNDGNIGEISPIADANYRENVSCVMPTLAQVCKWLRSKDILIHPFLRSNNKYSVQIWKISSYEILETLRGEFDTYEQAQSAGIDVVLELLEKSKKF